MGDRCRGQGASSAQGVGRLFWKKRSDPCWASFPLRLPDAPCPSPILLVPREPGIAGPLGGRQVSPEASPICPALKTIPSPSPSDPGVLAPRSSQPCLLPRSFYCSPHRWILVSTSLYQTLRKIPSLSVTPFLPARTCSVLLLSLGLLAVAALRGGRTWDSLVSTPLLAKANSHTAEWEEAAPSHP